MGLATAVDKLVNASIVTISEVLELFRIIDSLYEKFDCSVSITSLVDFSRIMCVDSVRDYKCS